MKRKASLDTALEAADILRGMCNDREETNPRLKGRIHQLEMVLMENHIVIPDHEIWHGKFPMA